MSDDAPRFLIAVVDDDRRILDSLRSLLESADYDVREFESAEEFLESGCLPQIDCLISDISMARMDGYELTRTIHGVRPQLPVVLVTGRPDLLSHTPGSGIGRYRAFLKPFDGQTLLEAVSDARGNIP